VLGMYSLGVITGGAAVFVTYLSLAGALTVGVVALATTLAGVALLEQAPYEPQNRKSSKGLAA